ARGRMGMLAFAIRVIAAHPELAPPNGHHVYPQRIPGSSTGTGTWVPCLSCKGTNKSEHGR
ncbi:MAG: hypothetical protein ACKOZX_11790, partial [Gammaproteobacteria bacterium]